MIPHMRDDIGGVCVVARDNLGQIRLWYNSSNLWIFIFGFNRERAHERHDIRLPQEVRDEIKEMLVA